MRTVYTVNTSNKFAALSNSDDDEVVAVEKKEAREKSTPGAKENPSSLIYPKSDLSVTDSTGASADSGSKLGQKEGSRKSGTVHRGGRGGFKSNHGRTFDRRDASGKGHRVSKQSEFVEGGGHELKKGDENPGNLDSDINGAEIEGGDGTGDKQEKELRISYEEYMRILDAKKLETPATEKIMANTTHKDLLKEGLTAYVRDNDSNQSAHRNRDRHLKSNPTSKTDRGIFNYFELVDKYGSRNSFGNRRGGGGSGEQRRGRNHQKNNTTSKFHGVREAPDVSDTRAFPTLGQ